MVDQLNIKTFSKIFLRRIQKKSTKFRRLPDRIENIFIVKDAFVKSLFGFNNRVGFFVGQLKSKRCRRCTNDHKMRRMRSKRKLLVFIVI